MGQRCPRLQLLLQSYSWATTSSRKITSIHIIVIASWTLTTTHPTLSLPTLRRLLLGTNKQSKGEVRHQACYPQHSRPDLGLKQGVWLTPS